MPGLSHEALIYRGDEEFAAAAVPFLQEGLEAGEALLVVVSPERTAQLRAELGSYAAAVRFADMREVGRNPARLIPFWREFAAAAGRRVRGIGEPVWAGRGAAELDECLRHESLVNRAFGDGEWSLLCPYDGTALDEETLAAVSRSHAHVSSHGERWASDEFRVDQDCFGGRLPPPPVGTGCFRFARSDLHEVRGRVARFARTAGLPACDTADLIAAASELAANSIAHAGGTGTLRLWQDGGELLVEVSDRGRIADPLAGRVRPSPAQPRGRGLWLANQLCDLVQIRSGPAGTAVRLHAAA